MSRRAQHAPKHRGTNLSQPTPDSSSTPRRTAPRHARLRLRIARRALTTGTLAVAATGLVVGSGVFSVPGESTAGAEMLAADLGNSVAGPAAGAEAAPALSEAELEDRREGTVSRSDNRERGAKAEALSAEAAPARAYSEDLSDSDPRTIARALLGEYGFSADQFGCLDQLYVSESDWRIDADNPTSSAYGIPQALTETHDMPPGYFTSAEVQIRWGLDYIRDSYGSPCSAWSFKQANNWY